MRKLQVDKLYRKLAPHEQAALVFESVIQQDQGTADTVFNAVEKKTYTTIIRNV